MRGKLVGLYQNNKPYTKGEVAKALIELTKSKQKILTTEQRLLKKLLLEFEEEIDFLNNHQKSNYEIQIGTRLQGNIDKVQTIKTSYKGIYRTKALVQINNNITIYNGINVDQYLVDDPLYRGKEWRGAVGYNEQAYITGKFIRFQIKFGRDFLKWGAGRTGTLMFSDVAQPMDQFNLKIQLGSLQYNYFHAQLDPMDGLFYSNDSLALVKGKANRYISAHRVDMHFLNHRLECSIAEGLLYSGLYESVDFSYINPFIVYYGAQINKSDEANMFTCADIRFYLKNNLSFYSSLLIDDFQVEKTGPVDLEPNEIGYILGLDWADPFNLSGFLLSGEYTRVTNRTYKTPNPWESFLYRNRTLGHPLGNDFDLWLIELCKWWTGNLIVKLDYQFIRKGEGSIYTPWDEPWMDYTVNEGYSEPFPTGIVEKRNRVGIDVKFYPSIHWGIQGIVNYLNRKNADCFQDNNKDETQWRIGIWWQGDINLDL